MSQKNISTDSLAERSSFKSDAEEKKEPAAQTKLVRSDSFDIVERITAVMNKKKMMFEKKKKDAKNVSLLTQNTSETEEGVAKDKFQETGTY